jgi:hypothetical protein
MSDSIVRLSKYKQNLSIQCNDDVLNVWCYDSNIGRLFKDRLEVLNFFKKYSPTTTKHYKHVSAEYDLPIKFVDTFTQEVL